MKAWGATKATTMMVEVDSFHGLVISLKVLLLSSLNLKLGTQ